MKATTYHLRALGDVKTEAGSLGLSGPKNLDLNGAAEQLTERLDIIVTPSGRVSYARKGQPVTVYLALDPADTEKGKAALAAHREEAAKALIKEQEAEEARQQELLEAVNAIGLDEATEILRRARQTQK